jgi:hypothetical protein
LTQVPIPAPSAHFDYRATAIHDLEAAIRSLRSNWLKICRTMSVSKNPVRRSEAKPMKRARA